MAPLPPVIRTIHDLRAQVAAWRVKGHRIGLVPTMGALHHGHLSLINAIAKKADKIIVSIFVNPTQFGKDEDLDAYPRQEQKDLINLTRTPTNLVFAPAVSEMYPTGHVTSVTLSGLTEILEGAKRPKHFDGVATIVTKLLLQCQPDIAIFGEKDYQQLAVIRQFVQDLDIPTEIMGGTLIREADGLAASSRNVYLTPTERSIASQFNVILKQLVTNVINGQDFRLAEQEATNALIHAGFKAVDYVSICDEKTLQPLSTRKTQARVLAVARIGSVRLLDNMAIEAP